jgi:hypothetical protein
MDKECLQLLKFIINNRDKSFFLKTNEEINAL